MSTDEHEHINRRFSVREWALGIGLLFNFGTLLWNTATAAAKLDSLRVEVSELKQSNAALTSAVNRNQLLEYRITELEKRLPLRR